MKKENIGYYEKTIINGETAIKPYYYMRNGLLHARYTVDRCINLSKSEEDSIKAELTVKPEQKQQILSKSWNFLTTCVEKDIIYDGVKASEERMEELTRKHLMQDIKNGNKKIRTRE